MNKYKVTVEGLNFLIDVDHGITKLGFITDRFVEAWDEPAAETKVMAMLREELKRVVRNERSDSPVMFVEEIEELESFGDFMVPGAGFVWYPDREGH